MIMKNMTGIYVINNGRILMLKRTKADSFDQYYSVGGRMESEELNNPLVCVLRELKEETGIMKTDLQNIKLKYIAFRQQKDYISQNYIFFAELRNKDITLKECNEGTLEWININDIFSKKLPATSHACLKHYFEMGIYSSNVILAGATNSSGCGEYTFTELSYFDEYDFS